jgi:hypothetical protein
MIYRVFVNFCTLYELGVDSMRVSFLHMTVGSISDVSDGIVSIFRVEVCSVGRYIYIYIYVCMYVCVN